MLLLPFSVAHSQQQLSRVNAWQSSGSFVVVVVNQKPKTTTSERRLIICRFKTCRCELSIVARHDAVRDRSAAAVDMTIYLGPRDHSEVYFFI